MHSEQNTPQTNPKSTAKQSTTKSGKGKKGKKSRQTAVTLAETLAETPAETPAASTTTLLQHIRLNMSSPTSTSTEQLKQAESEDDHDATVDVTPVDKHKLREKVSGTERTETYYKLNKQSEKDIPLFYLDSLAKSERSAPFITHIYSLKPIDSARERLELAPSPTTNNRATSLFTYYNKQGSWGVVRNTRLYTLKQLELIKDKASDPTDAKLQPLYRSVGDGYWELNRTAAEACLRLEQQADGTWKRLIYWRSHTKDATYNNAVPSRLRTPSPSPRLRTPSPSPRTPSPSRRSSSRSRTPPLSMSPSPNLPYPYQPSYQPSYPPPYQPSYPPPYQPSYPPPYPQQQPPLYAPSPRRSSPFNPGNVSHPRSSSRSRAPRRSISPSPSLYPLPYPQQPYPQQPYQPSYPQPQQSNASRRNLGTGARA